MKMNKKAQEEMVGFVVILVIVAVILLVLLSFLIKKPSGEGVENYEVENFIQATLQYTTNCEDYIGFLSLQDLIIACEGQEKCLDERDSCKVLNDTLTGVIEEAWDVGQQSAVKGYKFKIVVDDQEKTVLKEGNETLDYKGAFQDFARRGTDYVISLNIYY